MMGREAAAPGSRRRGAEVHVSDPTPAGEDSIRMSPEEEEEALEAKQTDEATEPADEGVGAHTDAQDDPHYTEN